MLNINLAFFRLCISEKLKNHCQSTVATGNMNEVTNVQNKEGDLIASLIDQMQFNLDGALSCITIIADPLNDVMAKGRIIGG